MDVRPGEPIPAASIAGRTDLVIGEPSDWNELDRGIWIARRKAGSILEQVLPQQEGYGLILLTLPEEAEEDVEDAASVWEAPRIRR